MFIYCTFPPLKGSRIKVSARESTSWGWGLGCDMSWWKYMLQKNFPSFSSLSNGSLFSARIHAKACAAAQPELCEHECELS